MEMLDVSGVLMTGGDRTAEYQGCVTGGCDRTVGQSVIY